MASGSPDKAVEFFPDPRFGGQFDTKHISKTHATYSRKWFFFITLESRAALDDVCFQIAYQIRLVFLLLNKQNTSG